MKAVCDIHPLFIAGQTLENAVVIKKMTQPLPSWHLQFKNQQHFKQSFNFERKPGLEAVLGPSNQTHATGGEDPHQP